MTDFWHGRRVLLTGHTGFKGAWLALWLARRGAEVHGLALDPEPPRSLFEEAGIDALVRDGRGDIRDPAGVGRAVEAANPEVVFHLAAQSLVLRSYSDPLGTWATNVMGSAHLLEALRHRARPAAVVMVTTDKVYLNPETGHRHGEEDRLGGHDAYSASKAAMELAVASWRDAFLAGSGIRVASARAGNVIGGGDWAEDRIVPDIARAVAAGIPVPLRNPEAVRPWQHVLEPLAGYLILAERLAESDDPALQSAFNFGPEPGASRSVRELAETFLEAWPGRWQDASEGAAPHEARLLALDSGKARRVLGVMPRWGFEEAVRRTAAFYRAAHEGEAPRALMEADIAAYEAAHAV